MSPCYTLSQDFLLHWDDGLLCCWAPQGGRVTVSVAASPGPPQGQRGWECELEEEPPFRFQGERANMESGWFVGSVGGWTWDVGVLTLTKFLGHQVSSDSRRLPPHLC